MSTKTMFCQTNDGSAEKVKEERKNNSTNLVKILNSEFNICKYIKYKYSCYGLFNDSMTSNGKI
jgi:hypothetical protein